MTKYIIGTISDMDTPLTPSAKGSRSLSAYMNHIDYALIQMERDQVLGANVESIRKLEGILSAVIQEGYLCAIGNEDKIEQEHQLFLNVENLYNT